MNNSEVAHSAPDAGDNDGGNAPLNAGCNAALAALPYDAILKIARRVYSPPENTAGEDGEVIINKGIDSVRPLVKNIISEEIHYPGGLLNGLDKRCGDAAAQELMDTLVSLDYKYHVEHGVDKFYCGLSCDSDGCKNIDAQFILGDGSDTYRLLIARPGRFEEIIFSHWRGNVYTTKTPDHTMKVLVIEDYDASYKDDSGRTIRCLLNGEKPDWR